jgi:hypothetical protein
VCVEERERDGEREREREINLFFLNSLIYFTTKTLILVREIENTKK